MRGCTAAAGCCKQLQGACAGQARRRAGAQAACRRAGSHRARQQAVILALCRLPHLFQHRIHQLSHRLEAAAVVGGQRCRAERLEGSTGGGADREREGRHAARHASGGPEAGGGSALQARAAARARGHAGAPPHPRLTIPATPWAATISPDRLSSVRFHSRSSSSVPTRTPKIASLPSLRRFGAGAAAGSRRVGVGGAEERGGWLAGARRSLAAAA